MMMHDQLPITGQEQTGAEAEASCGPKVYVTLEEAAVLSAIRKLRDQGIAVRNSLGKSTGEEREHLQHELESLRSERKALEVRREQAWRRKMIMLGHLPPDAES